MDHTAALHLGCWCGGDAHIPQALVIALRMVVHQVLTDDMVEAPFTEYHHLIEGFILNRAHEPFAMSVAIWAPRW